MANNSDLVGGGKLPLLMQGFPTITVGAGNTFTQNNVARTGRRNITGFTFVMFEAAYNPDSINCRVTVTAGGRELISDEPASRFSVFNLNEVRDKIIPVNIGEGQTIDVFVDNSAIPNVDIELALIVFYENPWDFGTIDVSKDELGLHRQAYDLVLNNGNVLETFPPQQSIYPKNQGRIKGLSFQSTTTNDDEARLNYSIDAIGVMVDVPIIYFTQVGLTPKKKFQLDLPPGGTFNFTAAKNAGTLGSIVNTIYFDR